MEAFALSSREPGNLAQGCFPKLSSDHNVKEFPKNALLQLSASLIRKFTESNSLFKRGVIQVF